MTQPRDDHRNPLAGIDPHSNPDVWAPRLTRVLDRQIDLYTRLRELAERQSDLVRGDQPDALLELLAQRQVIVQQVTDLNQQLEPFTRQWSRLVDRLSLDHRRSIGERTGRLDSLIGAIAERDEGDRRTLESRRSSVAAEIHALSTKRAAVAAYRDSAGAAPGGARFQDREG